MGRGICVESPAAKIMLITDPTKRAAVDRYQKKYPERKKASMAAWRAKNKERIRPLATRQQYALWLLNSPQDNTVRRAMNTSRVDMVLADYVAF